MRWDSLIIQPDFLLDHQVEPLCRYFLAELRRCHSQSKWSSKRAFSFYTFPATPEFWDLVRHPGNADLLRAVDDDFEVVNVRLHCRRKLEVTSTHFDGQCNYVLGVVLSGEKIWSVKKVTYWDLVRHNYLPSVKHNTYDNVVHGQSLLWNGKAAMHAHSARSLLFLPPAWYHTVIYGADVVSFDLQLVPKREIEGGISRYAVPFLFGSRGAEHGADHTGPVHWALRHGIHGASHLLRMALFPTSFGLSLKSRFVPPKRVAMVRDKFAPVPPAADGTPRLRQIDQDCITIIEELLQSRAVREEKRAGL
jgi:hypothetical protein